MRRKDRRNLEIRLQQEVDHASQRLLEDPDADISQHARRIEHYSLVLTARERQAVWRRYWVILVSVVCVAFAGVLWGVRVQETKVVLNVQSEAVAIQLASNWVWSGDHTIGRTLVRVEGLTEVDGPVLGASVESVYGDAWVQITHGDVSLVRFEVGENGVLQFVSANEGALSIYVRGARLEGELAIKGSLELTAGNKLGGGQRLARLELAIPETVVFSSRKVGAVPVRLQGELSESWRLNDIPARDLGFQRQAPGDPGEVSFVPTITGGTITLPEVSRTVTLHENDYVSMRGIRGRVVEMKLEPRIALVFHGTATEVRLGPPGYAKNLMPTYLEYFYFNQPLAFFWSAALFFWGLLWGVWRTLWQ
jgi:hypothetical protein